MLGCFYSDSWPLIEQLKQYYGEPKENCKDVKGNQKDIVKEKPKEISKSHAERG